ncbi:TRAP transporter substrate-binding protein DctP [Bosea sp. R86505]|uniref:TRAP transporter substrate-binding protein DctP n=1 Tax=Bosea sp. R86505 TaxID=3101710 RepID=UPI0036735F58
MTTRRTLLKSGAFALTGAIGAPFVISPARSQSFSLRMQGFLAAASPTHRAFEKFAADLKEKSGGKLLIQVLPAGGAVGATETINAIAAGILDGHYSSSSFFAARDPGFTVFGDTGASYDTVDQRDRWYLEGGGEDIGRELYAQHGLVYVANIFWPSEQIPAKKAIRGVADLKGLKIRVPPGFVAEYFGKAGASVINLPGGEVFNALQSGVLDATDWASPGQNYEVGLYKAAKFSVDAAHSMPATELGFAKAKWEALPAELKQLILAETRAMSAALKVQIRKDDDEALAKMKGEGIEIVSWSKEEIGKLRAFTGEVQDALAAKGPIAKKVVESHRAFQKKIG